MEKLHVEGFLTIRNADFEIGRINLIIGSQANGKSLLAKLLYFFREFLNSTYLNSIKNFELKRDVEKKGLLDFEKYFPKYTWSHQLFSIKYSINDIEINISRQKSSSGKITLNFNYSTNLVLLHKKLKNSYKNKQEEVAKEGLRKRHIPDVFWQVIEECVYNESIGKSFNRSLFVPASRSFFANLQKNVFSFLASNIEIDPFISDFGSQYQTAKRFFEDAYFHERSNKEIRQKVDSIVESILVGKYKFEDDQDWIEHNNIKVNLSNASSGQQEALPMLLVMSMWSSISFDDRNFTLFIEEPEAHLFPISQKHIVSLMALIHNVANHDFIITTHSPYILTAINNLVLASDVAKSHGKEKIKNIIDPDFLIDFEHVRAYTIKAGVLESIIDNENRLIGANVIDSVSDEFESSFDKLLNIQNEID